MRKALFLLLLPLAFSLEGIDSILSTDPFDMTRDGDVIGSGAWSEPSGGFRIDSTVTENAGLYTYSYWVTNDAQWYLGEDFDSFTIEIGDQSALVGDIVKDLQITSNVTSMGLELNTYDYSSYGGGLGSFYGLEFDINDAGIRHLYLEFSSYLAPKLGEFFATGVGGAYSYNAGFNGGSGMIYTPDSDVAVPEPATYFLMGTMLFAAMLARRKKLQRQA